MTGVLPAHVVSDVVPAPNEAMYTAPGTPAQSRPAAPASSVAAAPAPAAASPRPDVRPALDPPRMQGAPSNETVARASQQIEEQAARLAAREQAVLKRERELAEQRRVMAEEYRLIHQLRSQPTGSGSAGPSGRTTEAPRAAHFAPDTRSGFVGWLKRLLNGGSPPAVEGR
jgi:hypothetical protein